MAESREVVRSVALSLLLVAAGCAREQPLPAKAPVAPPVIIISVDTLRADHLPAYGYRGVATPSIDAFRRDAILFKNAYSPCPLTLPSHASLLTGRLPGAHGVRNNIGYQFRNGETPAIGSLLKGSGYVSGAAVSSFVLRGSTGLGEAFDFYDDGISMEAWQPLGHLQRSGTESSARALKWIAEQQGRPFVFLLHLFEPHSPYTPPEPFRSRYRNPYDGEIAAADSIVGKFLEQLRSMGVYDHTAIFFLSDHGEGLGDHGEAEHGIFLYREAIQVPLILKLPGRERAGTVVDRPVQLTDVVPTILALANAETPRDLTGISLLEERVVRRTIFSETMYPSIHLGWSELRSLIDDQFHYIDAPGPELYDIRSDPGEKKNVASAERRRLAAYRDQIAPFRVPAEALAALHPEEAAKLAALGYLTSVPSAQDGMRPDPKDRIGDLRALDDASRLANAKKFDAAIEKFKVVVQSNPNQADAWSRLAQTYEEAGRLQDAAHAYRSAMSAAPALASQSALSLASVYLKLGDLDQARSHAEVALRSNLAPASLILGRVKLAQRDFAGAEAYGRVAGQDAAYASRAAVLMAQAMVGRRETEQALGLLEKTRLESRSRGERSVEMLDFARGDALARLGRVQEAESAFLDAIRLDPGHRHAYAALAALHLLQKAPRKAEAVMEKLVGADSSRESFELAARTFQDFGDVRLAAKWRERGVKSGR